MNKCIKLIVLVIALCTYGINGYCQNYFNNLYNYEGTQEFNREIHLLPNGNIIAMGGGWFPDSETTSSRILREINPNGNLIWEDHLSDDTYGLYGNWNHTSIIIEDSILIITSTAEKTGDFFYQHFKPYFLKYNLHTQTLERLKFFDFSEFNISVYSAVLHTDGYIYSAGLEYTDEENKDSDLLLLKFDINGNLVWKKT